MSHASVIDINEWK